MNTKKRSFFERLSGTATVDDYDSFEDDAPQAPPPPRKQVAVASDSRNVLSRVEEDSSEGQLPVDVYQTTSEIVIRAFVAGVRADELNVSISRDMVVVEGSRDERDSVPDSDYFTRELFWGSFARTVLLPQEIDVDTAAASAKDGLLTIVLPKLDKTRQTKLRVKVG
jgi:HSP20 family protein